MAFVIADRVRETTTTTGTGSVTLGGAYTSFQTFSAAIGNANNTYYTIASATSGEWEVGIGTYSSSGNLLSRDTVLSSSNGGSLVSFTSGTKDVFVTQPASRAIFVQNAGTGLQTGTTAFTASRVLYANATSTTTTSSNLTFDGTTLVAANFTDSSLTSGRVTYATTGGNLTDSANLLFDGTTLTANALTTTSTVTINGGTANGVAYLNGSKVLTTGSALTFDGTNLGVGGSLGTNVGRVSLTLNATTDTILSFGRGGSLVGYILQDATGQTFYNGENTFQRWYVNATEQMRLTSTGLGIGTSSPSFSLDISVTAPRIRQTATTGTNSVLMQLVNTGGTAYVGLDSSSGGLGGAYSLNLFHGGAYPIVFSTSGTERMRLDASGNLGLGVTPSAWSGIAGGAFQNAGNGSIYSLGTDNVRFAQNVYFTNTGYTPRYVQTREATEYRLTGGQHQWYTAPSGTAGNAISFNQAMTLDASGNLLVGTTSASIGASGRGVIEVNGTSDSVFASKVNGTLAAISGLASSTEVIFGAVTNVPVLFRTNNTERARITSGGYFKASNNGTYTGSTATYHESYNTASNYTHVFTNTNASPVGPLFLHSTDSNGTANEFWYCQGAAAQRAALRSNGGLANYSANDVNLSDRREKTNFAPAKSYLDTICAIPVQTFNYIDQSEDDPGLTLGVVAQDVQAVAPELVMESNWGTEDTPKMRLSVYQTDLQYALMKALQELKSELDSVKAELATLKGA